MPPSTLLKLSAFILPLAAASSLLPPAFATPAKIQPKQSPVTNKVPYRSPTKDKYGIPVAQIEHLLDSKDTASARAVLARVPRCKGDEDRRNMILGAMLATDSDFERALPVFTKVKHPEQATCLELYLAAKTFAVAQNIPKAIEIATIGIDRNHDQKCLETRAGCYSSLDRYNDAIQDFETLAKTEPHWAPNYLSKEATLLIKTNKYKEALAVAERAVKSNPNEPIAQMTKGTCLARLERYDEAVAALTKARQLTKAQPSTRIEAMFLLVRILEERANSYQKMGKLKEAEADKIEIKSITNNVMDDLVGK